MLLLKFLLGSVSAIVGLLLGFVTIFILLTGEICFALLSGLLTYLAFALVAYCEPVASLEDWFYRRKDRWEEKQRARQKEEQLKQTLKNQLQAELAAAARERDKRQSNANESERLRLEAERLRQESLKQKAEDARRADEIAREKTRQKFHDKIAVEESRLKLLDAELERLSESTVDQHLLEEERANLTAQRIQCLKAIVSLKESMANAT